MALKGTIPWVGGGAAVAVGLVWARRALNWRGGSPRLSKAASRGLPDINLDPDVNLDERARDDALHDMGGLENDEIDFDADTERQPVNLDALEVTPTVGPSEHMIAGDEQYDAMDAEDVGTAWLRRATQSEPSELAEPSESLEGTHEVLEGDPALFGADREDGFGSDQTGALSPTDEEIARRHAALEADRRHSQR